MVNQKYFDMSIEDAFVNIDPADRNRLQDAFNYFIMRGVSEEDAITAYNNLACVLAYQKTIVIEEV